MNIDEVREIAIKILNPIQENEIECKNVDNETIYFYTRSRSGGSLIIGKDMTFLYGNSSIDYNTLLAEYNNGRRSKPINFNENRTIINNTYGFSFIIPNEFEESLNNEENIISVFSNNSNSKEKLIIKLGLDEGTKKTKMDMIINNKNKELYGKLKKININNHLLMYEFLYKESELQNEFILLIYNLNGFLISFNYITDGTCISILYNILNSMNQFDTEYSIKNKESSVNLNIIQNPFIKESIY